MLSEKGKKFMMYLFVLMNKNRNFFSIDLKKKLDDSK